MHLYNLIAKSQGQRVAPGTILHRGLLAILVFFICCGLFSTALNPVSAQDANFLLVQPPDLTNFPTLSVNFKIPTTADPPIGRLEIEQLKLYENEQIVPVESLVQRQQGVHFTLAINGVREFDLRDENGVSLYDRLKSVLIDWVETSSIAEGDTWSLMTSEGFEVRNSTAPEEWIVGLQAYQPDFRNMSPQLLSLESAIQNASTRVGPFGVDKSLLFITPPPTSEQIEPIKMLTEKARSAGVHVNVWMLGEPFFLNNDQGGALIDLAASTNGQFVHITDPDTLPNPGEYLSQLGSFYTLTYQSDVRQSGTYPLRIQVTLPDGHISGQSPSFFIDVRPPEPILISPPASITRQAVSESENPLENLRPTSLDLNIMIEFPDGRPREIVASRLLVDGKVMDEHFDAPMDVFTWDLSNLTESDEHTIHVEVEDALGLSASTILAPVQIDVVLPAPEPPPPVGKIVLIIAGILFAAALILLAIWLVHKFWPSKRIQQFREEILSPAKDSLAFSTTDGDETETTYATLIPLGSLNGQGPIVINRTVVSFGCDQERADLVLDGVGVEGLHAQLRIRNGTFWLVDLESVHGTWVNYAQIDGQPVQIMAGDLIHFGDSGFKFTIINSDAPLDVKVVKYEPIL